MAFEMHSGVRPRGTIKPAAAGKEDPGKEDGVSPLMCRDRTCGNGCTKGGLDWTTESISSLGGWSDPGRDFLERWLMPQAC